jgi:hypothetical protein
MSDQRLLDYLLEDGPHPGEALMAEFFEEEVPEALAESTLNKVALLRTRPEVSPQSGWRWAVPGATLLAMAAALFLVVLPTSEVDPKGNIEGMTAKGEAQSAPKVSLKLAVVREGVASRHRADEGYSAGDELLFRVQSDSEGLAYLLHATEGEIQVLLESPLVPGESDLALADGQHARWVFDQDDRSSLFAVLSSSVPLNPESLRVGLLEALGTSPMDSEGLCLAAQSIGCQCDAIEVMVLK